MLGTLLQLIRLHASLLLGSVSERLTAIRLMPCLHCTLLVLPADKSAVRHWRLGDVILRLFVEGLGSFTLLRLRQIDIMVVTLKKFLDAGPLKLCLMLKHLL